MKRTRYMALGALGMAGAAVLGAKRAAEAPPDPEVAARAEAEAYSGPWTHGYVTVNGVKLHYAEMGSRSAPMVLLLHGFPQCWYQWRLIMPRLAERFHVVAPDMRGYNWSGKPPGVDSYAHDRLAADVAALVEVFGRERAHVVGHDWGGLVAWYAGIYRPERVDRLVVLNAPHPGAYQRELTRTSQLLRSYYVYLFQLPWVPEALSRLTVGQSLRASAVVPGAFPDEAIDVYRNGIAQPGAATAMVNYYRAGFRYALRHGHTPGVNGMVARPTMLIWGMKDFALVPELSYDLDRWVPGIRIERIHDCGHWVAEEKPRVTGDLLLGFLGD
ncbi:MAG TPA: alpha/beta fold hydrolase [Chloroflexia bacterium]|nr:alpha/beta fold hydrolase [Chloroflexia bacterium]